MTAVLVDKSAYVRLDGAASLPPDVELVLAPVTRHEILSSARSPSDFRAVEEQLDAFRTLRMDAETFAVALTAHRELAVRSQHRVPLPDLLLAACAQQHGADVLHVDRHFETLTTVLAFRSRRLL
jgi:predicted nucleic acid-binding protein